MACGWVPTTSTPRPMSIALKTTDVGTFRTFPDPFVPAISKFLRSAAMISAIPQASGTPGLNGFQGP